MPRTVSITQPFLKWFRSAWKRDNYNLSDRKDKKKNVELQQLESEFVSLDTQCNYLVETISCPFSKFVEYTKNVEEKNQIVPLIEVNALKWTGKEKAGLVFNQKKRILKEKKKLFE